MSLSPRHKRGPMSHTQDIPIERVVEIARRAADVILNVYNTDFSVAHKDDHSPLTEAKMAEYTNTKAAYDKAKAEYDHANFLKRQLMREPVDPGVPPVRESNTVLKPAEIAEIDAQIQAKEGEFYGHQNCGFS